jgi:hypothetical protein
MHGHFSENEIAYLTGEIDLEEAAEIIWASEAFRKTWIGGKQISECHESRRVLMRILTARKNPC